MKKIVTIILDGFGISSDNISSAINQANMKNFNDLYNNYPNAQLEASGMAVGLEEGEFGNSEVGHTLIGAGRSLKQNQELVADFLNEGYKDSKIFENIINKKDKTFHMVGMLSDGKVHSDIDHFLKLYEILIENGITKINFHIIADGRDTAPTDATKFINILEDKIKEKNVGKIYTVCGRYYAMDRDQNFDRTKMYYNLITKSLGIGVLDLTKGINNSYEKEITDEFLKPMVTDVSGKITDGDIVLWMNYRNDRTKQILAALTNSKLCGFPVVEMKDLTVCTFLPVDERIKTTSFIEKNKVENALGMYLSDLNLTQVRIAESEKIAHVTYFFDGGYNGKIPNCEKIEVQSPDVDTYDLKPEMNAVGVTKKVIKAMEDDTDFILVNFANPDMVGHTGNMEATIKACMAIDVCLGKILEVADDNFYKVILTADHGNADKMLELDGTPCKTHSLAKVPFIIKDNNIELDTEGTLINIAPTILDYMNIAKPKEMQETISLIKNKKM